MPDDIAQDAEALKTRLVRELTDAPQGITDEDMPPPPPLTHGQVGPSPTENYINPGQRIPPVGAGSDPATGEEVDPGVANAGGVNAKNTGG